jgi:hypothetical protein
MQHVNYKGRPQERLARYRPIRVSVIGGKSGRAISIPDPNVSRSRMTAVTYLLGEKSRKL